MIQSDRYSARTLIIRIDGPDDVTARAFVQLEIHQPLFLRRLQQLAESPKSVVGFVETGFAPFDGLLDHRTPQGFFFPPFLDDSCQTGTLARGGWGSVTEIALRILGTCTVATEESTWGAVKALYQD